MDWVLQEDLEKIALSELPLEKLKDSTILVTGATGLIGSQIIKTIICLNRIKGTNIKVLALIRNVLKAKKVFRDIYENEMLNFIVADIIGNIVVNDDVDYIIHTASITTSKLFIQNPVKTIDTMILGTKNILELAKNKDVKSVIYISSMEVYGITDPTLDSITESDLGYIDILDIRSSYSEGKRMAECMCAAYSFENNINIKIARLSQTFGAGVGQEDNRIFSQFAKSVINKTDIVLHTAGTTIGNYCYTRDAIRALFILLVNGESGQAYNISNEKSIMAIKDMALMVAKNIAKDSIKVIFDIPNSKNNYGYAPETKMRINSKKMMDLGWVPEVGLEESYCRMIESMILSNDKN